MDTDWGGIGEERLPRETLPSLWSVRAGASPEGLGDSGVR